MNQCKLQQSLFCNIGEPHSAHIPDEETKESIGFDYVAWAKFSAAEAHDDRRPDSKRKHLNGN